MTTVIAMVTVVLSFGSPASAERTNTYDSDHICVGEHDGEMIAIRVAWIFGMSNPDAYETDPGIRCGTGNTELNTAILAKHSDLVEVDLTDVGQRNAPSLFELCSNWGDGSDLQIIDENNWDTYTSTAMGYEDAVVTISSCLQATIQGDGSEEINESGFDVSSQNYLRVLDGPSCSHRFPEGDYFLKQY